jgi:hypothetical protein
MQIKRKVVILLSERFQYQFEMFILLSQPRTRYGSAGFHHINTMEVLIMINFDSFVGRHGECAVEAIIEGFERREGIRFRSGISLEERWDAVMRGEKQRWLQAA